MTEPRAKVWRKIRMRMRQLQLTGTEIPLLLQSTQNIPVARGSQTDPQLLDHISTEPAQPTSALLTSPRDQPRQDPLPEKVGGKLTRSLTTLILINTVIMRPSFEQSQDLDSSQITNR